MHKRKLKIRIISLIFLSLAGFVVYKVARSLFVVNRVISASKPTEAGNINEFSSVNYTSVDNNSNKITLTSSKVTEVDKDVLDFKDVVTTFKISPTETATLSANNTHFISKDSKKCNLKGAVKLYTEEGLLLESEESFADIDRHITKGNSPISITQDNTKLESLSYHFDLGNKILTLTNNVHGLISGNEISSEKIIVEFDKVIGKDFKRIQTFGKSHYKTNQYEISANKSIEYTNNAAKAVGNVKLHIKKQHQNYHIRSDVMTLTLNNNIISKAIAQGKVTIKTKDSVVIKGDYGVLDNNILTISGNVLISNNQSNIICKQAIINTKTNDLKLYQSKGILKRNKTEKEKIKRT